MGDLHIVTIGGITMQYKVGDEDKVHALQSQGFESAQIEC